MERNGKAGRRPVRIYRVLQEEPTKTQTFTVCGANVEMTLRTLNNLKCSYYLKNLTPVHGVPPETTLGALHHISIYGLGRRRCSRDWLNGGDVVFQDYTFPDGYSLKVWTPVEIASLIYRADEQNKKAKVIEHVSETLSALYES